MYMIIYLIHRPQEKYIFLNFYSNKISYLLHIILLLRIFNSNHEYAENNNFIQYLLA